MTPKEYLQQYQRLDREINLLLDERQHWVDLATKVTPTYSDAPGGGSGAEGHMPDAVEKIIEWEGKIDSKVDELIELRKEIEKFVNQVQDSRQREILLRRYIQGQKWEQIAVEMHLDYRWTRRLHNKALAKLTLESPPKSVI